MTQQELVTSPVTTRKLKLSKTSLGINWEFAFDTTGTKEEAEQIMQEMITLTAQGVKNCEEEISDVTTDLKKKKK